MSQSGVLTVQTSGAPVVETLTGNTGGPVAPDGAFNINVLGTGPVTVSGNPGTHTLTISVSNLFQWNLTSVSLTASVNNGYICVSPGGALVINLPTTSILGDEIEVTLDGATSFQIAQAAGQQIRFGNLLTSIGVGGSITTTNAGDTVRLVCQTANTKWNVISSIGSFVIV
jgi:hypothetical protein